MIELADIATLAFIASVEEKKVAGTHFVAGDF